MNTSFGQLFIHAACCNTPQAYERSSANPGHVNKYPDRARQRAAAELAAALPKNPALRGLALAAFLSHPEGKRAAAAMDIEAPVYTVLMCGQWLSYACTMYRWSVWSAVYV